jgi:predicted RNA binding protein YcfA (HicA-like mRNA interferase family)
LESRDLIKILKDNEWVLEKIKGSHHIFTKPAAAPFRGPFTIGTDIPEKLAARILKEAGIK